MDRETKKIILPISKQEVEIYAYITGGDKKAFANIPDDEAADLAIRRVVKNVTVEQADELHGKDYDFLFIAISDVITASSYSAEKKSA